MSVKGNCAICINLEAHYGEYCQKCREEGYRRIMLESFESKTEKRIDNLEADKTETAYYLEKLEPRVKKLEQDWKEHIGIWTHIGLDKRLERLEKATKGTLFNYEGVGRIGLLENKYKKLEQEFIHERIKEIKSPSGAKEEKDKYWGTCQQAIDLAVRKERDKWDEEKEETKQEFVEVEHHLDILKQHKTVLKKEFVEDLCFLESQYPISTNEDVIRLAGEIKDLKAKYSKAELAKEAQEK